MILEEPVVELTGGKTQQLVTEVLKRSLCSTKHSFARIRLPTCTGMTLYESNADVDMIGNGCRSEALIGAAAA